MILPAGREKDQKLKKRYAVFNNNGTLAEMKGFELKRRGELKLIKAFQEEVFQQFLRGTTLVECYAAVADVANSWVDILDTHGAHVDDEELLDLLTESSNMSKRLEAYEGQRTAQVTTARRLAELLGDQVVQSEGLKCAYVVANKPYGAMVTERAVPTAVFLTDPATKRRLLSKWLKFNGTDDDFELRTILDWEYYLKRLGACIQKIVTIPAALQSVPNPVPRIKHPDWLEKQTREADARFKQASLETLFAQQQASKIGLGDVPEEKEEGKEGKEEKSGVSAAGAAVASSPAKKRRKKGEGRQSGIQGHLTSNVDEMVLPTAVPKRLDSFFVRQGHQLLSKPWHIVEVHETREPGEFRAWVFAENEDALRPITITVPRKFYVNFYKPPVALPAENGVDPTLFPSFDFAAAASSSSEGESATSTQQGSSSKGVKRGAGRKERQYANVVPPRSKVTHHMVEVRIAEREYLARQQAYADLVCDTNVEGVYETNVPLLSRLLATVGCVFSVRPEARSRADYARFAMDELQFVNTTSVPYLGRTPPPLVFLYHSLCRRGPRATLALVALVFPAEQRAWVALVGSGSAAAASAVSKRLGERAPELRTGGGIAVVRTATLAEAYAAANDALAGYYSAGHRTHIVVTQTPLPEEGDGISSTSSTSSSTSSTGETVATTLESAFPVLQSQMAHVRRPHDPRDGEYAAFDWEAEAAARLHAHYALCGEWFATQLALARYAHVPVGNVAEDAAVALPDVMFQRVLQDDRFVLWTSRGSRPDLGGSEDDDNQLGALEDRFPHVSCAGCYRDVCIDLDVRELALNAVAKAEAVAENDGGANMFVFASAVSRLMEEELGRTLAIVRSFDGTIDGSRPFREMRKLVQQWTADALAADADADTDPARSAVPRFFLLHLYRWLSSPHAALREPAITRVVTELMTRLFHQLLAELRRLGARVVYATFNRIVLSTGKYDVADALAYFHFLRRTVAAKPVFSSLVFEPRALYRVLLFLDIHNYGGVALPLAASSHSSSTSVDGAGGDDNNDDDDDGLSLSLAVESHAGGAEGDDDDSGETIISNWNIADFLPASMQSTFVLCVSAFIEHINEENKRHGAQLTARRDALAHGTGADAALLAAGDSTDIGLNPNVSMSAYVEGERDDDADADSDSWGASALSTDLTQQIFTFIQGLSSGSSPFLFFFEKLVVHACYVCVVVCLNTEMQSRTTALLAEPVGTEVAATIAQVLPSAAQNTVNPSLRFANYLCHLYSLDRWSADAAVRLKKGLLKIIGVREFTPETEFRNPCLSATVHDVVCPYCNYCTFAIRTTFHCLLYLSTHCTHTHACTCATETWTCCETRILRSTSGCVRGAGTRTTAAWWRRRWCSASRSVPSRTPCRTSRAPSAAPSRPRTPCARAASARALPCAHTTSRPTRCARSCSRISSSHASTVSCGSSTPSLPSSDTAHPRLSSFSDVENDGGEGKERKKKLERRKMKKGRKERRCCLTEALPRDAGGSEDP